MSTDPTEIFLWRALAIFLLVGAVSGIALSLLLIFKPHFLERVNRVANRWISTRRINQLLDRSIDIEHWFIQYHRPFGILVTLGAGCMLVYFGLLFDKPAALQGLNGYVPIMLLDGLLDALVLAALTGAVVALFAGLFLWLRPSLLRGIEEHTNQWVSSRRATRSLEIPRDQVDRFVARHARRTGWLLLLGSIYLFLAISRLLV
ncbi:MAG TPA: hypothetical protein VMW07_06530 [Gallionella sp.]|nr:hypothetical protein [Gallionella sp.]